MPDKYFLADLILTFTLLFLATFLVKEALPVYWLYLIFIILICSFCFSWFIKDGQGQLIKLFVTAGTFLTLGWMVYSILASSFLYKDVIIICIKGAIFLELLLSFNVYWPKYLAYTKALNVPLFMCFPLFIKDYDGISIIAILGYLFCWLVIPKVKFYEFFKKPVNEINFRRNYPAMLLAVIFITSLFISGVLFFKLPLRKVLKGGFFVDIDTSQDLLDKEYYDLQERLQEKITELIPKFGFVEDRYSALAWLSYLIKEPSTIQEVAKAQQGLISYLNTEDALGLEKSEAEEITILLRNFVDKKASFNLKRIKDDMMNALKNNPFNIKARIAIAGAAFKLQNSNSLTEVSEFEKQLNDLIDNSLLDASIKKELKELAGQLKEWKIAQLQHFKIHSEEKISEKKEIKEVPVGQVSAPAVKDYVQILEKYSQIKEPSLKIGVNLNSRIKIALKSALILILCVPIIFLVLYFLTEKEKNKLLSLCNEPREFIINLYDNLREVLTIFDARYSEVVTPLFYASWVEQRYSIKDNLFLKLTAKFEEAKYSKHALCSEDVHSALNDYNDFLKVLLNNQNKFYLILKYYLTLLYRKPLSVYRG